MRSWLKVEHVSNKTDSKSKEKEHKILHDLDELKFKNRSVMLWKVLTNIPNSFGKIKS